MGFKIQITEERTVTKVLRKKWAVVDSEEVDREQKYFVSDENEPRTRVKSVMGYTPEVEGRETQTREVLTQEVDELDVAAVIKAINGL